MGKGTKELLARTLPISGSGQDPEKPSFLKREIDRHYPGYPPPYKLSGSKRSNVFRHPSSLLPC